MVCASGPSFSVQQAALVRTSQPAWRVIAVNTTWQMVPTADVLYAGDRTWWEEHLASVRIGFAGECFTINRQLAHLAGISFVEHSDEPGLSQVFGRIHSGGNSGHAAIGLAYLFGARRILLVGFDFQDSYGLSHWHGDHPAGLSQERPYTGWVARLRGLIHGLQQQGVEVVNCSIETAIPETTVARGDLATCLS